MSASNNSSQLDVALLEGYLQSLSASIVKQMITLYSNQAIIYMDDIENSLLNDDAQLWQEHCHKMKGAAGSVGLKLLHARVALMEKTTENKTTKAQQLAELKSHHQQAIDDFNIWLESVS